MAKISVGQRVSFQSFRCTVRYVGPIKGKDGEWLGIEWDDASRGKHSGEYEGVRYFECRVPNAGSFVKSNRPHDEPLSFLQALHSKYVHNVAEGAGAAPVAFGSKVAEEVGFEKASRKFSNLTALRFVILDGMAIDRAEDEGDNIAETCPAIKQLDISRNLFTSLEPVANICSRLPGLTNLRINGNRFASVSDESKDPFIRVKDLEAGSQLLDLDELRTLLRNFPSLTHLTLSSNSLSHLHGLFDDLPLAQELQLLSLEENNLASLSALRPLQGLKKLSHLVLAGNQIETAPAPDVEGAPVVLPTITSLDVSSNRIRAWDVLNVLPVAFPNLEALRISHNPLYENENSKADAKFMLTIGRLSPKIKTLNFSTITPAQRLDAELYYMSSIVKEIESNPSQERETLKSHPRWQELQKAHGARIINKAQQAKPEKVTLGSKLIETKFVFSDQTISRRIPRTITVSALKGLARKMFGLRPTNVALQLVEDQDGTVGGNICLDDFRDLGFYVEGKVAGILVTES